MAEVAAEIVAEETELLRASKLEKRQEGAENEAASGEPGFLRRRY